MQNDQTQSLTMLQRIGNIRLVPLIWLGVYAFVILVVIGLMIKAKYGLMLMPGLGILGLFLLWRKPSMAFYGIVLMVPFDAYRGVFGGGLSISKLLGVLIVGIVGVNILLNKHQKFQIGSNLWGPIAGLFLSALVSAMASPWPAESWDNMRKLFIAITLFTICMYFVRERGLFRTLPTIAIIGTSISAFLAVYGYVSNDASFVMDAEPDAVSMARGVGAANDPNIFAMTLLFAYPMLCHLSLNGRTFMVRLISGILLLNNLAAIVITFSRGAALVFMICTVLYFMEYSRRFKPKYLGFVLLGLALALLGAVTLVPQSYWERQASLMDTDDSSLNRRKTYVNVSREVIKERPFFGYGPGCFKKVYGTTDTASRFARRSAKSFERYAHNTYLEVMVGLGLFGSFFFFLIMFVAWRDFGKARQIFLEKGYHYFAGWALAYRVSLVGLAFNFLFLSNLYTKFFWVILGLAQISIRVAEGMEEHTGEGVERAA